MEDEIINYFSNGGGVPYPSYKRFNEVMAEESYRTVVVALVDHILPLVPNLIDNLKDGIKVLDIGCGQGRAINVMANHFKNSEFYGYDLSQEAIDGAKREAQRMGNSNAFFKVQDILDMNFDEKYDLITAFDAIHEKEFFLCKTCLHCVSVSLSQNDAGLGAMWGKEKATEMLNDVS